MYSACFIFIHFVGKIVFCKIEVGYFNEHLISEWN